MAVFETAVYTSNAGTSLTFGDTVYPAKKFEMKTYQVNDAVKKMQFPGRWPTFSYPEYREIHFEGDILGSDASDYNTKERAMRSAFQPPHQAYTGRRHGTLYLTFFGDATTYYAYVILQDLDIPQEALQPSWSEYSVTFLSFEPYLFAAGVPTTAY